MDTALFLQNLNNVLGSGVSMNGNGLAVQGSFQYSPALLQMSMCMAVRAYRRWRKQLRPYGTGVLYSPASVGASSIQVMGGPWVDGQTIQIGYGQYQETFSIVSQQPGTQLPNWLGYPTQLNLSGSLAGYHVAGIIVAMQSPTFNVVPGTPSYELPNDFVSLDLKSFNLANGSQTQVKQVLSFYDGAYYFSQLLSGVGWGMSQPFASATGPGFGGFGFAGVPDGPSTLNVPGFAGFGNQTYWEVMEGRPSFLFATPTPQFTAQWSFNYYAAYQPEGVPDEDFDALMDMARAVATEAAAQVMSGRLTFKEDDVNEMPHLNAEALLKVAKEATDRFDIKIRKRPFCITG